MSNSFENNLNIAKTKNEIFKMTQSNDENKYFLISKKEMKLFNSKEVLELLFNITEVYYDDCPEVLENNFYSLLCYLYNVENDYNNINNCSDSSNLKHSLIQKVFYYTLKNHCYHFANILSFLPELKVDDKLRENLTTHKNGDLFGKKWKKLFGRIINTSKKSTEYNE